MAPRIAGLTIALLLVACERPTPEGGSARDRVLDTAAALAGDMAADSAALWLADSTSANLPVDTAARMTMRSHLEALEVSRAGDLGYTRRTFTAVDRYHGHTIRGSWLRVWKRGADGAWRIATEVNRNDTTTVWTSDTAGRE